MEVLPPGLAVDRAFDVRTQGCRRLEAIDDALRKIVCRILENDFCRRRADGRKSGRRDTPRLRKEAEAARVVASDMKAIRTWWRILFIGLPSSPTFARSGIRRQNPA
jgi:hypothetical protein